MIDHTYRVLEYHHLLDILSRYASCTLGQKNCLSLKPSSDSRFIDNELRLVSEMRLLLKVKGFVSFSDLTDILPVLMKTRAVGSYLNPDELLCIHRLGQACQETRKLLSSQRSLCPRIFGLIKDMPSFHALGKALTDTISTKGLLKDSASPALKKIRGKKTRLRLNLQKKLESLQKSVHLSGDGQDNLVTVRDGRYVIAVRSDKKRQIDGIIHDYSQTRATCFLEPIEAIQDNNRVAELRQEEKTEELRILTSLTDMVRDSAADLEFSQSLIAKLDGFYARARFSDDLSCVMPEIGESCGLELKRAKNPILQALAVEKGNSEQGSNFPVPVDVLIDDQRNVLIISGPNRGGKTVTLKTLGLMSLMAQSGIHIPADEGSKLRVFDHIMADIGDDQDIQTGLSTFSAHATHLKFILEHANQRSLVIIDEPGMGTDPDEGVALAMAILDFLSSQGTFVAVSTHLNRLKTYGLLNHRAMNASVEFDVEKKCPTFNLKYGSPGISYALDTARDMGVSQSILDRAKGYLDQDEVRLNRLIEKLNRLMIEAKHEKEEAEEVKRKYHSATRRTKDRLLALEERKKDLVEAKRIEADAMIANAREELKQTINLLKEKKQLAQAYVAERYNEVSRKLMDYLEPEGVERYSCEIKDLEEGHLVYHKSLRQMGTVRSVDSSTGRVLVIFGKVKISAKVQDLESVKEHSVSDADEGSRAVSWNLKGVPPREINVIGYRVDDAIPLIDKTIDRALVDGQMTLKIIHGFGTGRLRQAIRDHLRGVPFVKRFCSADSQFGGDAVTVVELS